MIASILDPNCSYTEDSMFNVIPSPGLTIIIKSFDSTFPTVSVVNALSEYLEVEVHRDGKIYFQRYERGEKKSDLEIKGKTKRRGTRIHFRPDDKVFESIEFDFDTLARRMRELAFLTKGVRIKITDENTGKKKDFIYEGGIKSFVDYLNKNKEVLHKKPVYFSGEKNGVLMEIALQYNNSYKENVFTCKQHRNQGRGEPFSRIQIGIDKEYKSISSWITYCQKF